jgi:hypothetical protein
MPIIIDPYLLAIPTGSDLTAERIRDYARNLNEWEKEFAGPGKDYLVCDWAVNEIHAQNLAPTIQNLQALFTRFGIDEYSARDIAPDCQGFMANGERLEDRAGVYDCVNEIESLSELVIPDEIRNRIPASVAREFVKALTHCAYALDTQGDTSVWSMATAPLKSSESAVKLTTKATINRLCATSGDLTSTAISRDWPLLIEPDYIYAGCNEMDYYRSDPYMATRVAWCKMKAKGELRQAEAFESYRFKFGPEFLNTLLTPRMVKRSEYQKDVRRIFAAIVSVLEDIWAYGSDKHHALRKTVQSRTSDQQKRQSPPPAIQGQWDWAVRVEVIAGSNPLHLHYWRCFDGSYVFSNVTDQHDDVTIYG